MNRSLLCYLLFGREFDAGAGSVSEKLRASTSIMLLPSIMGDG